MVKYCSAPGCSKTDKDKALHFHSLPWKNKNLLKLWLTKMKLKNPSFTKHSRICSEHFAPECYQRDLRSELLGLSRRWKLKTDAVPTLFNFSACSTKVTDVPSTSSNSTKLQKQRAERVKRRSSFKEMQEVSLSM